jgi:hypothetical protein
MSYNPRWSPEANAAHAEAASRRADYLASRERTLRPQMARKSDAELALLATGRYATLERRLAGEELARRVKQDQALQDAEGDTRRLEDIYLPGEYKLLCEYWQVRRDNPNCMLVGMLRRQLAELRKGENR